MDLGDLIEVTWVSSQGDHLRVHRDGCIEGNIASHEPVQDGCADPASVRAFVNALRRIVPAGQPGVDPPLIQQYGPEYEFVQWKTARETRSWLTVDDSRGRWQRLTRPLHLRIDAARRALLTVNTPHATLVRRQVEAQPSVLSASFQVLDRLDIGGGGGIHTWSTQRVVLRADGLFLSSEHNHRGGGRELGGRVDPATASLFVGFLRARGWGDASISTGNSESQSPSNAYELGAMWHDITSVERCGASR